MKLDREDVTMNWNQPMCWGCWKQEHPGSIPFSRWHLAGIDGCVHDTRAEVLSGEGCDCDEGNVAVESAFGDQTCAWCGVSTCSGIFVRHDPRELPFGKP